MWHSHTRLCYHSCMRIIAGTAGGTFLIMPKGPPIRPTPDKVKQAIFSSLGDRVVEARVLDLFAGTGALGLEAVSRGAKQATLVEDSRFTVEACEQNATKTGLEARVLVERADAFRFVELLAHQGTTFDLIFADPPYEKTRDPNASPARKLLNCPGLISILAPGGLLVLEHFKSDPVEATQGWQLTKQLRHGDTLVSLFHGGSDATTTAATSTGNER